MLLLTVAVFVFPAGDALARNHIGLKYFYLRPEDNELKDRFDDPELHHILLHGDFTVSQGLDIVVTSGWGKIRVSSTSFGTIGDGEIDYTHVPVEIGLRLNPYETERFTPYVAAGPGVYFLQFKNVGAAGAGGGDSKDARDDSFAWGAWVDAGVDLHINNIVGLSASAHYILAQTRIEALDKNIRTGGFGFHVGFILFFTERENIP